MGSEKFCRIPPSGAVMCAAEVETQPCEAPASRTSIIVDLNHHATIKHYLIGTWSTWWNKPLTIQSGICCIAPVPVVSHLQSYLSTALYTYECIYYVHATRNEKARTVRMADPLSITTGVLTLLGSCISVGKAIKDFHDGAAIVDVKVKGLLSDVESFAQVLRMMKDTLEEEKVQSSLQATGHMGNHWNNLSTSIKDGQNTLIQLQHALDKVNKSVGVLDGARKHLRLKGAAQEIVMFQQQIRSYRDTIQLSLQTVIL